MTADKDGGSKTKYTVAQGKGNLVKCKVMLLDGSDLELSIDSKSTGQMLLDKVCEHINLLEKDYFCCAYKVSSDVKYWVQNDKLLSKQVQKGPWSFYFELKFYPQDPTALHEEITRYQVYLQIRVDILSGKLPCSFVTLALLGSYAVQSQLGDYDADEHGPGFDYIKNMHFCPGQTEELLDKIAELHRTHRGQAPPEAEYHYLESAKNLAMYGVHQHAALNEANEEVVVGVCAAGILVYRQRIRLNRFIWVKILKITYKRNRFTVILRPDPGEKQPKTIVFRVANYKMAKRLWKLAVEHHTFFRLRETESATRGIFSRKASRYYAGRTQYQSQQAADQIQRQGQDFNRVYYTAGRFTDRNKSVDGASTPGFSTERSEQTLPDSSYRTMTLDLKRRDKFSAPYVDGMDGEGGPDDPGMVPVTDASGRVIYIKKTTPSTSSDVFMTLQGQRRPSQDDLARTGGKDGAFVTLLVGPGDGQAGATYSKTPYPTGPGYVTPGGGPGLNTPGGQGYLTPGGYGTFNSQGGYNTGSGSPYYGTDDHHKQYNGSQDDPQYYQNSQSMARYGTPGSAGSRQMLDEHGNVVVTKNIYITTTERTINGRPDDDGLPAYQEDHLKQHGHGFAGGDGTWGPYSTSSTTKTMTRTYTAPDGTIVTEHRTEKNGVVETHIEKRTQTIDEGGDIDYDRALAEAIKSVTNMNTDLTVEKIEIHTKGEDD